MGLFDGYFDPDQFQDSGGLLGRLLSLQQQGQYQPSDSFDPQASTDAGPPSSVPMSRPALPADGSVTNPQTPDDGLTQNISTGDNQMPQPPGLSDRLSAGFQSWAQTPVGNPFAALANGIAGFGSGQRTDAAGLTPAQNQALGPSPDLGDRLSAGFQSWAHTPVGNPFAALANGVAGLNSGQRTDAAGMAQQNPQPSIDTSGNPQDLNAQYQALRSVLGDHNAMLAIVHPEVGRTLIAQALAGAASKQIR
jgi:hypothetical protein